MRPQCRRELRRAARRASLRSSVRSDGRGPRSPWLRQKWRPAPRARFAARWHSSGCRYEPARCGPRATAPAPAGRSRSTSFRPCCIGYGRWRWVRPGQPCPHRRTPRRPVPWSGEPSPHHWSRPPLFRPTPGRDAATNTARVARCPPRRRAPEYRIFRT